MGHFVRDTNYRNSGHLLVSLIPSFTISFIPSHPYSTHSTSNSDGIGIAWAVCERFIKDRIPSIFVTHYHQLAVQC
jgi:hypothetical protein